MRLLDSDPRPISHRLIRAAALVHLGLALFTGGWFLRGWLAPEVGAATWSTPESWPPPADVEWLRSRPLPVAAPLAFGSDEPGSRMWASYRGNLRLDEAGLAIELRGTNVRVNPAFPRDRTVVLDSMVLAIAEPSPTGWSIWRRGPAIAMAQYLVGEERSVTVVSAHSPLRMDGVRPEELVGRWPVFVYSLVIDDHEMQEQRRIEVLHHGTRDAFDALLTRKPWEEEGGG